MSGGRVLDELEVAVSPGYRCRRGQVSIRGDSTEIVNNFVYLSNSVVLSPDKQKNPKLYIYITVHAYFIRTIL